MRFVNIGSMAQIWRLEGLSGPDLLLCTRISCPEEDEAAKVIASEIANSPITRDKNPEHHLPEAYAIILMQRGDLEAVELLIDELAARDVARQRRVPFIGFPGILIRACWQQIIEPEDVLAALTECQRQGTHYSNKLINEIYDSLKVSSSRKGP